MAGKELLGIASIVFGAAGYAAYLWSIFKSRTKPHMFSWIVWGTVSGVAFFAQLSRNAGAGSWAIGASALVCYFIAVVASFRGERDITRSDWISLAGAFAAIPLWYATREPLWSVMLVVVIDLFGFYPTIRKSYLRPREESALMYALDCGKFIFSMLALKDYSATSILYPLCAMLMNSVFITMLVRRRALLTK